LAAPLKLYEILIGKHEGAGGNVDSLSFILVTLSFSQKRQQNVSGGIVHHRWQTGCFQGLLLRFKNHEPQGSSKQEITKTKNRRGIFVFPNFFFKKKPGGS